MNITQSFAELSARERVLHLLDANTFQEMLGPAQRVVSPHLAALGVPYAFDDGVVIGSGTLQQQPVLIAAQEGEFMGGGVGEVHGAKLTGLLRRALMEKPAAVRFDSRVRSHARFVGCACCRHTGGDAHRRCQWLLWRHGTDCPLRRLRGDE
jgi:biotin-independent malonate decarboxylase beta subunit